MHYLKVLLDTFILGVFILLITLLSSDLYARQFACYRMNSCAEACEAYNNGATYLDGGEKDGIPCSSLCDKPCKDIPQLETTNEPEKQKLRCKDFDNCFQACEAFDNGKLTYLDRNGDGIPCESICSNKVACISVKNPDLDENLKKLTEEPDPKKTGYFTQKKV